MPPHPLTKFEKEKYFQNKPKFNRVYSRNSLRKIKDGTYVKMFDVFKSIGTHWIVLYLNGNNIIYFDSFQIEHIQKEIQTFIVNKNIIINIYEIQAYNLIMCGYFLVGFIDFMVKD